MRFKHAYLVYILLFLSVKLFSQNTGDKKHESSYKHQIGFKYFNYISSAHTPHSPYDILTYKYEALDLGEFYKFSPQIGIGVLDWDFTTKPYLETGFELRGGKSWLQLGVNSNFYFDFTHSSYGFYSVFGPRITVWDRLELNPSYGWSFSDGYYQTVNLLYPAITIETSFKF